MLTPSSDATPTTDADAAGESLEAPAQAPSASRLWMPGRPHRLSRADVKAWCGRRDRAESFRKQFEPQWERALKRYAQAKYEADRYDVNALMDFRHVENKKASMFHQTPTMQLQPVDPKDQSIPYTEILPLRQKYLNHQLGQHGANAKRAFHKAIVDAIAASCWIVLKIGYENRTLPVPDPVTGKPMIGPDGKPVNVPIWDRAFMSRVSPMKALVPHDFRDTDFDESPWLGVRGVMPLSQAKRQPNWTIPNVVRGADGRFTSIGAVHKDEAVFSHGLTNEGDGDPLIEYDEIWYKAHLFDSDVWHPELYRCLVLIKGLDEPACCVDSPYQTLSDDGSLSDDSLIGNPIHIGSLRDLPDSAYVPCDLVVGEQLSREVNKFRTQAIRKRGKNEPFTVVAEGLGQPLIEKIAANEGPIPVPDHYIDAGGQQKAIAVVQAGTEPRDNFTAQDYAERDWQQALGSSDARSGQISKKKVTATEIRNVAGNAAARDETEKQRVSEIFVGAVWKFDTILQRTATPQKLQKVLGSQGAVLWQQWQALPGKYAYSIVPDSGTYLDAQQARASQIDEYNIFRKDERVNPDTLLEKAARVCGYDPATFIAPPRDKVMEPPTASISFKGEDVSNPAMGNLLLDFCANSGLKMRPETIQAFAQMAAAYVMQTLTGGQPIGAAADGNGHGGAADRTEPINKHSSQKTGGVQGVGIQ
jgi:hypothetical protein